MIVDTVCMDKRERQLDIRHIIMSSNEAAVASAASVPHYFNTSSIIDGSRP